MSAGSGFSIDEIAARNTRNLADSARVKRPGHAPIARPVWRYNAFILYGQSLSVGQEGWPALSTHPQCDALMLGHSTRGAAGAAPDWVPLGEPVFRPLRAVVQQTARPYAILPPARVQALPASAPNLGEDPSVAAVNFFRRRQLEHRGVALDVAHRAVAASLGAPGESIERLSKGATPELFNRLRSYARAFKSAAGTRSCGVAALLFMQGESNSTMNGGAARGAAAYQALLARFYDDFNADITAGLFGQAQRPAMFTYQTATFGAHRTDATRLGVQQGQLNQAIQHHRDGWYLVAPSYPTTDKGIHLDANGYRMIGAQFGKVMHQTITLGQSWLPLYPHTITSRGAQILLDFHVPEPPLAIGLPYLGYAPQRFADLGFTARDTGSGAMLAIRTASIVSDSSVLLTLDAEPSGPITVSYGDQVAHQGCGNIRDSDATVADDRYAYDPAYAQWPEQNLAELVGRSYALHNWCCLFWRNAVAG